MKLKILEYLFFLLTLVTLIFSLYLTKLSYSTSISCSIFDGCDIVLTSKYSRIFNIPISIFGVIYSILIIFLFYFKQIKILLVLSFTGTLISFSLLYIQFFILKSICFYCTLVDTIFIIIFFLILFIYFKKYKVYN